MVQLNNKQTYFLWNVLPQPHKLYIDRLISYDFNVFTCVDTDMYIFNNNYRPIKHCFEGLAS